MLQDTSLIPTLLRAYSEAVTMIGGIRVDIVPSSLWLLVCQNESALFGVDYRYCQLRIVGLPTTSEWGRVGLTLQREVPVSLGLS